MIIAVSGADYDDIPEFLRKRTCPDLTIVRAGLGVSNARNAGAAAGDSPWILFLDADVLLPDFFVAGVKSAISQTQASALTFGYYADSHRTLLKVGTRACFWYLRIAFLLGGPALPGFATLVRRSAFGQVGGFRTGLALSEDFVFSDDLRRHGHVIALRPNVWLLFCVRRFDTTVLRSIQLLWSYLIIDLARRISGKRYQVGQVAYEFGGHARHRTRRRYPNQLKIGNPRGTAHDSGTGGD